MSEIGHKEPIIAVKQLVKNFSSQRVLDGINLEVYPSEIMVIMGGSGCGKSTLLRHLIGLLIPDEGSVRLFGKEITTMPEKELDAIRKQFGILFQSALFSHKVFRIRRIVLPAGFEPYECLWKHLQ